jgi:hypothetical protein
MLAIAPVASAARAAKAEAANMAAALAVTINLRIFTPHGWAPRHARLVTPEPNVQRVDPLLVPGK